MPRSGCTSSAARAAIRQSASSPVATSSRTARLNGSACRSSNRTVRDLRASEQAVERQQKISGPPLVGSSVNRGEQETIRHCFAGELDRPANGEVPLLLDLQHLPIEVKHRVAGIAYRS